MPVRDSGPPTTDDERRPAVIDDAPQRMLIVDDDRAHRMLLRHALEQDGYDIQEADDGAQCIRLCESSMPDVVLMDGRMPEMDGFETCEALRALPGGSRMPILLITGLDDEASVNRAFEAGATDFVSKPVNWAVLRQRVRRMVEALDAERHLNYVAFHDPLTGLANRSLFHDRLQQTLAQARRDRSEFAILFLDLDRFKLVNDTLGHDAGDQLLKAVADRLVAGTRETDTVGRLSGDEFVVLLRTSRNGGALDPTLVAHRLLDSLVRPVWIQGQDLFVTASIGIAVYPRDGTDVTTLLKRGDTAMYQVKAQGKNDVRHYSPDLGEKALAQMSIESGLRRALEREEFTLHYQPIMDLRKGEVVAFEALVRWDHPELGRVSPDQFIPLAEETGCIFPLGDWVLRRACAQALSWQREGATPVAVSVNVSGRQFMNHDFPQTVFDALGKTGLRPRLLTLELTENVLIHNVERDIEMIRELRRGGVAVSIDDFGTGYSSLACLRRLPINTIKVDRSFVLNVPADPDDTAIVDAIVAMAHRLRLPVVAEGVEDREQLEHLREINCDFVQGYFIARPMPAEETNRWLDERRLAAPLPEAVAAGPGFAVA